MESENNLRESIKNFLDKTFEFIRLEIFDFMEDKRIFLRDKRNKSYTPNWFDEVKDPCLLLDVNNNSFQTDHSIFNKNHINYFADEFTFRHKSMSKGFKKNEIKNLINQIINSGEITKVVKYDKRLKDIIQAGRKKIKGVKPLRMDDKNRKTINANVGGIYYVCYLKSPYIVSPCYILGSHTDNYRLLVMTNIHKKDHYQETNNLKINDFRYISSENNEIGETPEQAVTNYMHS